MTLPHGIEWAALAASYLLGAVPFGWVLVKLVRGIDLRAVGSGNIGATNAMRVLGKPLGLLAFFLDFAKGLVPVLVLAPWADPPADELLSLRILCGAAAVCGHVWPVWLRFRGGKAVATGCGALIAIDPWIFVAGGLGWLAAMALFRMAGLASMVMGLVFPLAAWWRASSGAYGYEVVWGTMALFLLILVRHRSNMARMLAGTEPRVGRGEKARPSSGAGEGTGAGS